MTCNILCKLATLQEHNIVPRADFKEEAAKGFFLRHTRAALEFDDVM